jgi:hypothetical protein
MVMISQVGVSEITFIICASKAITVEKSDRLN